MGVIYGLMPYLCVLEPLVVAGTRFTSAYEGLWPKRENEKVKLQKLLGIFHNGRGQQIHACTWFILRRQEARITEEVLLGYHRLISAVQFALLESEGWDSGLTAEQANVWLFQQGYASPALDEQGWWQTVTTFHAGLDVFPQHDKFYPRQPQLAPRHVTDITRVRELLARLLPPTARLGHLSQERRRILDSLPFFILGCSSPHTVDIRARTVNLVTAFEILLNLGESRRHKQGPFVKRVVELLRPAFAPWAPHDVKVKLRRLGKFCHDLYLLRDAIVHEGETRFEKLLFRGRPDEQPYIGYVWKARQIFVACVRAKLGILDPVELALILEHLVSNEDRLRRAQQAFAQEDVDTALSLVTELRQYSTREPAELILDVWKQLVGVYVARVVGSVEALPAEVAETLQQHPSLLYHSSVFRRVASVLPAPGTVIVFDEKTLITFAMRHFAEYAGYALSLPHRFQRQDSAAH